MVTVLQKLENLVGKDLNSFKIISMIEVYRVDVDGMNPQSICFFRNPILAEVFAGQQEDSGSVKTASILVLTDGYVGFTLNNCRDTNFLNENDELVKVKKTALAKMSDAERQLLGISPDVSGL